jgi:hypothetical protein
MGEKRNPYWSLVGKPERKKPLKRPRHGGSSNNRHSGKHPKRYINYQNYYQYINTINTDTSWDTSSV